MKVALTIAGSDSGSGAGIQADLKTFAAFGVYGINVITALTAQNTQGVFGVAEQTPKFIAKQLFVLMKDIGCQAAKTGMLYNSQIIEQVSHEIKKYKISPLVVDPVMVAKGGHPLLKAEAEEALVTCLLPLANLLTPNIDESVRLAKMKKIENLEQMKEAALKISMLGPRAVLIKGGHLSGRATDLYFDGRIFKTYDSERIDTSNTHGTGCTYSAAITACLARGLKMEPAIDEAKKYVTGCIKNSVGIGHGFGPLDHFWSGKIREC
ncbi:MAG: bifunctional hydroxymethylpyrimidine kinase/phosphomethylpyrimidine kinase [Candidatus Edwardsbacteria bacterium RIFOXYD12_FULL_50_11]|jgi:hydroxymethylpyrimidine/phosphomethylpyrimidine kinase|uniref:hydroxymethylpyrimidine kinase n=1 Tax=Candidatus Edwardsbacteria bacterium GWF2_54_11 TaxID=1817851 RepID=A0A1F5R7M5_9BACT|nr:MAG: bifunctional hydroxymethylpyrimidine kinase/phosphomethylpyrimidine kinase [Candidatus Edwardsbacteria bacterium RifOxyC12_full_54_24]OGF07839.1 MAG: bifunctional hydroxymethylpyrimidine kinase/phosphomethylpyrimidine kinase [Candidatus Edwardsbacteria bacterium RifOxyA12_full_54_48]OGF10088.1 MAG: bifunctional hydroxymethylpyrimidine kinase/phosphomethylpyrimidine kinase [Candidatus Edwardsbacteria bacterium GWE2_54_12]OGF10446.1 MAG: bifunctional hydroxymethylpyrimidine kinase/phosphom